MATNRQPQTHDISHAGTHQARNKGKMKETNKAGRKELKPKSKRQAPEAGSASESDGGFVNRTVRKKQKKAEKQMGRQEDTGRASATNQVQERKRAEQAQRPDTQPSERARHVKSNAGDKSKKTYLGRQGSGGDTQEEDASVVIVEESGKKRKRDNVETPKENATKTRNKHHQITKIIGKPAGMCSYCYMTGIQCTYRRVMIRTSLRCDSCCRNGKICSNRAEVKGVVHRHARPEDSDSSPENNEGEELVPANRRKVRGDDIIVVRGSSAELEDSHQVLAQFNHATSREPSEDSPPPQTPEQSKPANRNRRKYRRAYDEDEPETETSERDDASGELAANTGVTSPVAQYKRHQAKQITTSKGGFVRATSSSGQSNDDGSLDLNYQVASSSGAEIITNPHDGEESGAGSSREPDIATKVNALCSTAERIQDDVAKLKTELDNHSSNIRGNRQNVEKLAAQQATDIQGLDESLIAAGARAAENAKKVQTQLEKQIGALQSAHEKAHAEVHRINEEVKALRIEIRRELKGIQRLTAQQATDIKGLDESLAAAGIRAADRVKEVQAYFEEKIGALQSAHEKAHAESHLSHEEVIKMHQEFEDVQKLTTQQATYIKGLNESLVAAAARADGDVEKIQADLEQKTSALETVLEKSKTELQLLRQTMEDERNARSRFEEGCAQQAEVGEMRDGLKQLREDLAGCDKSRLADNEEVGKLRVRLNAEIATLGEQQISKDRIVGGLTTGLEAQVSAAEKLRAQFEEQSSLLAANGAKFEQYANRQDDITKELREDLARKAGKDLVDEDMKRMGQQIQTLLSQQAASAEALSAMSKQRENDLIELKKLNALQLKSTDEIALLRSTVDDRLSTLEKSALRLHNVLGADAPGMLKDMAQVLEEVKASVGRMEIRTVASDGKQPLQPISPAHKRIRQLLEDKNHHYTGSEIPSSVTPQTPRPSLRCVTKKLEGTCVSTTEGPSPLTPHPDERTNPVQDSAGSVAEDPRASGSGGPDDSLAESVAESARGVRSAAVVAREKLRAGAKDSNPDRGAKRKGKKL